MVNGVLQLPARCCCALKVTFTVEQRLKSGTCSCLPEFCNHVPADYSMWASSHQSNLSQSTQHPKLGTDSIEFVASSRFATPCCHTLLFAEASTLTSLQASLKQLTPSQA